MKVEKTKKLSAWVWAFLALMLVFFSVGVATLGSFKTSGKSAIATPDSTLYYAVELKSGEKLNSVYVKFGSVYTAEGGYAKVTVKTATSANSTASFSTLGAENKISNVYSKDGHNGVNYNWFCLTSGNAKTSVKQLALTTDANVEVCEVVALNEKGEKITLKENSAKNTLAMQNNVAATLDAQNSFVDGANAYNNFTQDEGYMLSTIATLLGKNAAKDNVYTLFGNFNYFAVLVSIPLYLLFGGSVFALRITAFLATCALIAFAWALARELFKEEKAAFVFTALIAFGGMATTVGRLGSGYALVASALMGSVYFAYRFFARGISAGREWKGGMNVFLSGVFAAAALAFSSQAIFPVLGVLTLLGFGMRRQYVAYKVAAEKIPQEDTEKARVLQRSYEYKNRVAYGFAALSFIATTFVLLLVSAVLSYNGVIRVYGNQTGFAVALWKGIASSFRGRDITSFTGTNASSVFAWWLPLHTAKIYSGVGVLGEMKSISMEVLVVPALRIVCPLAFLGATAKIIFDFVKKDTSKDALRVRRGYFLFLGGLVAATVAGLFVRNVSLVWSFLFNVCYVGFLPLLLTAFEKKAGFYKIACNVLLVTLCIGVLVTFGLSVPAMYGII